MPWCLAVMRCKHFAWHSRWVRQVRWFTQPGKGLGRKRLLVKVSERIERYFPKSWKGLSSGPGSIVTHKNWQGLRLICSTNSSNLRSFWRQISSWVQRFRTGHLLDRWAGGHLGTTGSLSKDHQAAGLTISSSCGTFWLSSLVQFHFSLVFMFVLWFMFFSNWIEIHHDMSWHINARHGSLLFLFCYHLYHAEMVARSVRLCQTKIL